jgi:hypothetical protein
MSQVHDEIIHEATDANPENSDNTEKLVIQPDTHGLSIEFPQGQTLVVDLSQGCFSVLRFDGEGQSNPVVLWKLKA